MRSFNDLLKQRRSTRKFTDQKINQDDVVTLMKAALMSPASKRSNPWQFVIIDDVETIKKLSLCKEYGSKLLDGAPLAIVVMADPLISDVWIEDASIATILMQLQAEALGLGSCWVHIRERFNADGVSAEQVVRDILDIPLQMQVLSIVAVGHKDEEKKPFDEDRMQWEKVHINKYGGK